MPAWLSSTLPIATLFAFRMLGLFMLIPVFTVYAYQLQGATPGLIGIALGAYGLTQGLLQLPFGILSDRFGRKPLISIGLILFAGGSLLGAVATHITTMIVARILQGAGAIGSVLIALLADCTAERDRTKAMAVIGITIALSFSLALVISPSISQHGGLAGIFYLTALLAVCGLLILHKFTPEPAPQLSGHHSTINSKQLKQVFLDPELLRLDAGIFLQHFMLINTFFALPIILHHQIQQGHLGALWHFYLPLMIGAFVCMIPLVLLSEKTNRLKILFIGSVTATLISQIGLIWLSSNLMHLFVLMFVYFIGFNLLEASLPSLISQKAHPNAKGAAMGIYSSSQFLGIFVGGSLSGVLFQYAGATGIFGLNALVASCWLLMSLFE